MNWLAIGILSLLALSMMISSKRFRVFMGTAAVVVLMIVAVLSVWGMRALPSEGDALAWRPLWTWDLQIAKEPNLRETAAATLAEVLADMEGTDIAKTIDNQLAESIPDDRSLDEPLIKSSRAAIRGDDVSPASEPNKLRLMYWKRIKLVRPPVSSNIPQEVTLHEKMANVIREYLKTHHNSRLDPGVDQLQPEDLDWRLLHFQDKGTDKKSGVKQVTMVFDDKFHNHVRERGRQLVTKDHLKKAGFTSLGTLAMLTTLFGLLKLKHAKRKVAPPSDLLASSGVWMV